LDLTNIPKDAEQLAKISCVVGVGPWLIVVLEGPYGILKEGFLKKEKERKRAVSGSLALLCRPKFHACLLLDVTSKLAGIRHIPARSGEP